MSIEVENSVIGGLALLQDMSNENAIKVLSMLKPDSFQFEHCQVAFRAIQQLANRGVQADLITIEMEAKKFPNCPADIFVEIAQAIRSTPSAANILSYAKGVRDKSIRRFAEQKMNEVLIMLNSDLESDISEVLGLAESTLGEVQERAMWGRSGGLKHISEVTKAWTEETSNRIENGHPYGFTTGIESLDSLLRPKRIPEGSLVVIGARPKSYKTAMLCRLVTHFALKRDEVAAVFSLEMPDRQIWERLLVGHSQVDPAMFYSKNSSSSDWGSVIETTKAFNASRLHVDDTPGISLRHLQREVRKLHKKQSVRVVAVDYLTLMEAEKADRNDLAYAKITKALKNLAKEINGVVIMLSQLNRAADGEKPKPSHSRDTGAVEQDADIWIGLHNPKLQGANHDYIEVITALNRHGQTGSVYMEAKDGMLHECCQETARSIMDESTQKATRRGYDG